MASGAFVISRHCAGIPEEQRLDDDASKPSTTVELASLTQQYVIDQGPDSDDYD